jgi:hypothetical protein
MTKDDVECTRAMQNAHKHFSWSPAHFLIRYHRAGCLVMCWRRTLFEDRCNRYVCMYICMLAYRWLTGRWHILDETYLQNFFCLCDDATSIDNIVLSFKTCLFLGYQSHAIWTENCFIDLPCYHHRVGVSTIGTCVHPHMLAYHNHL